MWKVWRNANVDLGFLAEKVLEFLRGKGCVCKLVCGGTGAVYKVYFRLPSFSSSGVVVISRSHDFFRVDFSWKRGLFIFFSNFASLFGGGVIVSRVTKDSELVDLDRFEDAFWVFVEDVVRALLAAKA